MHPFPTHLFGNHKSVLYDCGDSLHITDICTDEPVEDTSRFPFLPPPRLTYSHKHGGGSVHLWVVLLWTLFMFSLVCSILLCLPEVFSLFLEDLDQKWPLSDALPHTSSHWRIDSLHPHPRALLCVTILEVSVSGFLLGVCVSLGQCCGIFVSASKPSVH